MELAEVFAEVAADIAAEVLAKVAADIAAEVLVELAAGGLGCRSQIWPVVPVV